jgi:hypothetical protein
MKYRLLYSIAAALVFCGFSILNTPAFAARQTLVPVEGTVTETSGAPLGFATVALMSADSTLIAGTSSDENGRYKLNAPEGEWTLCVSLIGYRDRSLTVMVQAPRTELPSVALEEDAQLLESARVTAKAPIMEVKIDKVVMNVAQSAIAQQANGLDILKKAPGVVIDKDGNITLNGKSVAIWMDGRPSHMDGKALQAFLRGTEGSSIDKIELIEHPSSKYDAEGSGGIINIRTKRNMLSGLHGSLGADLGGMYFGSHNRFAWEDSEWGNLSWRTNKTNTFLNFSHGDYCFDVDLDVDTKTESLAGTMEQLSQSFHKTNFSSNRITLGNDWFVDKRNTLGFIIRLPWHSEGSKSSRPENVSRLLLDGTELQKDESAIINDSHYTQVSANLNYTHIFDETRAEELTVNLDAYRNGQNSDNKQDIWTQMTGGTDWTESGRQIIGNGVLNILSAKADYQRVLWGSTMFEAGAKWARSSTANDTRRVETGPAPMDQTTSFTYLEHIGAAYFNFARQLGAKWSVKAGLRAEYTWTFGDWITAGTDTRRHYLNWFPTLFVGWQPTEKQNYALSLTRRVHRPGYWNLNPVEEYIDAHTSTVGNPDLLPEFTNSVGFQAGFGQHFSFAAHGQYSTQVTTQIPTYDASGNQRLEWGNFGRTYQAGVSANMTAFPVTSWLDWTVSITGVWMQNISDATAYKQSSYSGFLRTSLAFSLPADWKIEWDAYGQTPMVYTYLRIRPSFSSDLAIRKTFFDGALSLNAGIQDIFRTSQQNIDILDTHTGNVVSVLQQKYFNQRVNIGLTWSFGKATGSRRRNVGELEEASRASGGGGIGGGR